MKGQYVYCNVEPDKAIKCHTANDNDDSIPFGSFNGVYDDVCFDGADMVESFESIGTHFFLLSGYCYDYMEKGKRHLECYDDGEIADVRLRILKEHHDVDVQKFY